MPQVADTPVAPPEADLGTIGVVARGVAPGASADDRILSADTIRQKAIQDSQSSNVNTETQWAPAIMAFFGGNAKEALKYFNGGPTKVEEAYHPTLGKFLKEYNARGVTGRVFVQEGDKQIPLDNKTIAEIDRAGGLISQSDLTAMQSAPWSAANETAKLQRTGLAKPVLAQYEKSNQAAIAGTSMRNSVEGRRSLLLDPSMKDVFGAISKLSPEMRQRVLGMVMMQSGKTTGTTQNVERGATGSANIQTNVQGGGNLSGGVGGAGAVPPTGPLAGVAPGLNAGASISGGQSKNVGATGRYGEAVGVTGGTSESIQANVQSEINRILQGAIQTPEQFTKLQKAIQLGGLIDEQLANQKPEDMAPGASAIAPLNPILSSRQDVVENDIQTLRNNSLSVAWNAYLAKAIHEDMRNSEPQALDALREKFMKTRTFSAIQRTYDRDLSRSRGENVPLEEGGLYVDRNNRIRKWNGSDWESK